MMISPILTYNSEVWGVFIKSDFKNIGTPHRLKKVTYSFVTVFASE